MDIHATALKIGERGLLIRGVSGMGKSSLALRLLQSRSEARLLADDRVLLEAEGRRLAATAPDRLVGLLEVRGLGIVRVPHLARMEVTHVVDLVTAGDVERLPPFQEVELLGIRIPRLDVAWKDSGHAAAIVLAFLEFHRIDPDGPEVRI